VNPSTQLKDISSILIFLLFVSVFSILFLTGPPTVVAQGSDIIIQGQSNHYNSDISGDPPWKWYSPGDNPPIMVAKRVGFGAVVASGSVGTCRNGRWTSGEWDVLLDEAFQWMVPGENDVLWYEGYNVYNDCSQCSSLIAALTAKGYTTTCDDTEPISSSLLASYDVLVIPQLQLGVEGTGGDPDLLPDSDVQAIVDFVEGGGGLLIMEGSDWYTYQYYKVQNKILKALNMDMGFQSDTIEPNSFGSHTADVTNNLFGADYQARTGKTTINMYGTCSMAEFGRFVVVSVSPLGRSGEAGENLTYTVTISNRGENDDVYSLEATADNVEWEVSIKPSSVSVPAGNENIATLSIKIPDGAVPGDYTWATVTATSQADNTVSSDERVGAEISEEDKLNKWTTASKLFPSVPDYGVTVAGAGENIYMTNTSEMFRYNTTAGWWEKLLVPGQFMNGSCLCWGGSNHSNYIYALGGGSYSMVEDPPRRNYKFYRYDIANNSWTDVADTPWHQGPGDALTRVEIGGNVYIYAFLGTSSNPSAAGHKVQFWRYDIASNNWDENLAPPLHGADDGASLAWLGGDYIYAFPGAYHEGLPKENERFFLRYSISGDNWVEMAKTPYNIEGGVDDGGALAYPGFGDYIYALKGGSDPPGGSVPADNFWRYNIYNDNWEILDHIPAGVGDNNGRRLGTANGSIYCWRGCFGDGTLWTYTLSSKGVDLSISPDHISGMPGATLEYTVKITNTDYEDDNYVISVSDNAGWNPSLSDNVLEVPALQSRTTILSVTIPIDVVMYTKDNIIVMATLMENAEVSDNVSCVARAVFELSPGWNLISFWYVSENDTPENLLENATYTMWEWDPVSGSYVKPPDDEPVELGVGYWLTADENKIKTSGVPVDNFEISLVADSWNLTGFPIATENDTPANLLENADYYSLWKWDPISGGCVKPPDDQPVEFGVGYWLKTDENEIKLPY
jgi:hypothetical protein